MNTPGVHREEVDARCEHCAENPEDSLQQCIFNCNIHTGFPRIAVASSP